MRAALLLALAATNLAAQYAADSFYDPVEMEKARENARQMHGGRTNYFLQADRFEAQSREGAGQLLWENQGWAGADYQKFWFKSEGEYIEGGRLEHAEIQGLYSRAISPFFDVQAGIRQDLAPGGRRTFGVLGLQGLAPHWFEVDAAMFVSHEGDISARLEAEYDLRFTQRLILQPRAELNFAVQGVEELAIGAGLSIFETGARLRYEFKREFAPYIGISWERSTGRTSDLLRLEGRNPRAFSIVSGLRLWL